MAARLRCPVKKLSVDELLRLACVYAEQDRTSLLDAMGAKPDDDREIVWEIQDFLTQLRAYRKRRWGRTKGEALLAGFGPKDTKTILEIRELCPESQGAVLPDL